MAKQKSPYTGVLTDPFAFQDYVDLDGSFDVARFEDDQAAKLAALHEHYGTSGDTMGLLTALVRVHVPGFRVVYGEPKSPGRKQKWAKENYAVIFATAEKIRRAHPGIKDKQIVHRLITDKVYANRLWWGLKETTVRKMLSEAHNAKNNPLVDIVGGLEDPSAIMARWKENLVAQGLAGKITDQDLAKAAKDFTAEQEAKRTALMDMLVDHLGA